MIILLPPKMARSCISPLTMTQMMIIIRDIVSNFSDDEDIELCDDDEIETTELKVLQLYKKDEKLLAFITQ
ncbi:unnamed protein product [Lupinus luteus]|uniref:Uncharacterized protein n=1 Tax=Lupinus luteus TaxID=3873 RepID=A0AAV1W2A7_LUPLU